MERPYRVILTGRSALKLGEKRGWRDPEHHLRIADDWRPDSHGLQRHAGLIYTVELNADGILESLQSAVSYTRHITDQLSLVHGVMIEHPYPQFSIDIASDTPDRELAQVLYNVPIIHEPRRDYNHSLYNDFHGRLDALRRQKPTEAQRIDRALHYLRNSCYEQDPIDQFEDTWVALEAINPLIRNKYTRPTTYRQHC